MWPRSANYVWPEIRDQGDNNGYRDVFWNGDWIGTSRYDQPLAPYLASILVLVQQQHKETLQLLSNHAKAMDALTQRVDELAEMVKCMPPTQGGPEYVAAAARRESDNVLEIGK